VGLHQKWHSLATIHALDFIAFVCAPAKMFSRPVLQAVVSFLFLALFVCVYLFYIYTFVTRALFGGGRCAWLLHAK